MSSLYKNFETDTALEQDGIYLEYGVDSAGKPTRFKVARSGGQNKNYAKVLEKAVRPHKMMFDNGTLPEEVAEKLMLEVFCTAVLLGWEGVDGRDGKPLVFSKQNAMALMTDLPELYRDISAQANKVSLFRKAELEADVKN